MATLIWNVPAFEDFKKVHLREKVSFKSINGKKYGNVS